MCLQPTVHSSLKPLSTLKINLCLNAMENPKAIKCKKEKEMPPMPIFFKEEPDRELKKSCLSTFYSHSPGKNLQSDQIVKVSTYIQAIVDYIFYLTKLEQDGLWNNGETYPRTVLYLPIQISKFCKKVTEARHFPINKQMTAIISF